MHAKTDLTDWALLHYLFNKSRELNLSKDSYIPINYKCIMNENPMLGISTKDPLTVRFKRLESIGLINSHKSIDNHKFIKLTNLTFSIIGGWQDE